MTQTVAPRSSGAARHGVGARALKIAGAVVNPVLVPLAGSGIVPIWGLIRHRGRRSGRAYSTPIALRPTPNGFVIPLPFGAGTDWCRNVLAARGGSVKWKGVEYPVGDPEVIDGTAARPAFPSPLFAIARALGIRRFLRVRRLRPA